MNAPIQAPPLDASALSGVSEQLLVELHLGSLGDPGDHTQAMSPACTLALAANFGSAERWRDEFIAMGQALGGGSGWLLLVFLPRQGTLVNQFVADHTHLSAGSVPVLALAPVPGMHEHADHSDDGAAAGTDVDALVAHIDWAAVYERYRLAVDSASEPLGAALAASPDQAAGAVLVDVRRAGVFEAASTVILGATWRDPVSVGNWVAELPADREVIVYCVHGHEVSRATALRLRAAGLKARYLRGGIEAWQAAGRQVAEKAKA